MAFNRRDFIKKSSLLGLTGLASSLIGKEQLHKLEEVSAEMGGEATFVLPALSYPYNALEPFIDAKTMEIHHGKHHQTYVDKLNSAISANPIEKDLINLFKNVSKADVAIRNNGGGHYNHSLFWQLLQPNMNASPNFPSGKINEAIVAQFGSFDNFKKEFSEKALKHFGSGWCWLIVSNDDHQLHITSTPNQDNPLMDVVSERGKIVLALDVWEHAYYLKYQNKRAEYITNWWNVVNWKKANELFEK